VSAPAAVPVSAPAPASGPASAHAPASTPNIDTWRAIVEHIRTARPALASVLEHAFPLAVGAAHVVVGFEASAAFLAARASEPESLETLTREVRAYFGAPTRVELNLSAKPAPAMRTVASLDAERRTAELASARAAIEGHPVVREVVRLFGAQIRDVKLPNGEA
jgi:hypothetical protein